MRIDLVPLTQLNEVRMLSFYVENGEFVPCSTSFPTHLLGGETFSGEIVIVLEADGTGTCDVRSLPSNGWIENKAAQRGVEIQWTARAPSNTWVRTDDDAIEAMVLEIGPLLARVHAGHAVFENAVTSEGTLSDDAQEAVDEIKEIIDRGDWWTVDDVLGAYDWLDQTGWEGVPLSLTTSKEDLSEMVDDIEQRALEDGIFVYDVLYALKSKRGELEDEAAEDAM